VFFKSDEKHEYISVWGGKILNQDLDFSKVLMVMSFIWFGCYMIGLALIRWRPTGDHSFNEKKEVFSDEDKSNSSFEMKMS